MDKRHVAVWIDILMKFLILFGSLCWLSIAAFDFNYIEWIADRTFYDFDTVIYTLVGISAILYLFNRDFFLPFLGHSTFPCGSMVQKVPDNADTDVTVKVEPHVNVIYWSSEMGDVKNNPILAYGSYSNAGVVKSDQTGNAVLRVRSPAAYKVPGKTLPPHVHYRTCDSDGLMSRIKTVFVDGTPKK